MCLLGAKLAKNRGPVVDKLVVYSIRLGGAKSVDVKTVKETPSIRHHEI